jgi:hypothetical protein
MVVALPPADSAASTLRNESTLRMKNHDQQIRAMVAWSACACLQTRILFLSVLGAIALRMTRC